MLSEVFSPTDLFGKISTIMGVIGVIAGFIFLLIRFCKKKRFSVIVSFFLSVIGAVAIGIITYLIIRFIFAALMIGMVIIAVAFSLIKEAISDFIDDLLDRFDL